MLDLIFLEYSDKYFNYGKKYVYSLKRNEQTRSMKKKNVKCLCKHILFAVLTFPERYIFRRNAFPSILNAFIAFIVKRNVKHES